MTHPRCPRPRNLLCQDLTRQALERTLRALGGSVEAADGEAAMLQKLEARLKQLPTMSNEALTQQLVHLGIDCSKCTEHKEFVEALLYAAARFAANQAGRSVGRRDQPRQCGSER